MGRLPAPKEDPDPIRPGSLFDPASVVQRLDYATGHVVGAASTTERARWETRLSGSSRESLKTLVAAWYGARGKSRDTFRGQLLDPYTSDETVDQLRRAVKGIVEALDGIAYAYLNNRVRMPAKLFQIFDELAVSMELDSDPEFNGVAQLRKIQGTAS